MKLRNKSKLLIGASTLAIALFFAVISMFFYRAYILESLHVQAGMAAELIRLTVTHEMTEGNPEHKEPYLRNLTGIPGLVRAYVIPARSVIEQYNIDTSRREVATAEELKVVETGKLFERLTINDEIIFHYTLPYTAVEDGRENCLSCHAGRRGDVLGAVSLEIDVTGQYYAAIRNTVVVVALLVLLGFMLGYTLRRLLAPIEKTTDELQSVVASAEHGDFSHRIRKHSDDEMGDIADRTNHLMETLEQSIGSIAKEVDDLVGHHQSGKEDNLLSSTASVVHTMALATHFKQVIENDQDLSEVYGRFQYALDNQFHLERYSYYEVSNSRNRMQLVFNKGVPDENDLWCRREITMNCELCRAKRTAQLVSSKDEPDICKSFAGNEIQTNVKFDYLCIPLMLSGSVGGVLQLVCSKECLGKREEILPVLRKFIDEAAPVIEAKRLMQSLRDSSMRDPLTNLYNRRFLEEYVATLTSGLKRRKSQLAVLMCDVDFFKQVNDTLGHEVGDDVLKGTCAVIGKSIRESDLLIRYGGEEFLVLLLDTDEEQAKIVAERIRTGMEEHKFKTMDGPLTKTLSLGMSMYPSDNDDFWECVKCADIALYEAKESGRNKVVRFVEGMGEGADKQ